jgi:hypothetical protein
LINQVTAKPTATTTTTVNQLDLKKAIFTDFLYGFASLSITAQGSAHQLLTVLLNF